MNPECVMAFYQSMPENLDSALEGRDDDDLTFEVRSRVFFNGYLTKA